MYCVKCSDTYIHIQICVHTLHLGSIKVYEERIKRCRKQSRKQWRQQCIATADQKKPKSVCLQSIQERRAEEVLPLNLFFR